MSDTPRTDALAYKYHGESAAKAEREIWELVRELECELARVREDAEKRMNVLRHERDRNRAMFDAAPASGPSEEEVRLADFIVNYDRHSTAREITVANVILRLAGRKP